MGVSEAPSEQKIKAAIFTKPAKIAISPQSTEQKNEEAPIDPVHVGTLVYLGDNVKANIYKRKDETEDQEVTPIEQPLEMLSQPPDVD